MLAIGVNFFSWSKLKKLVSTWSKLKRGGLNNMVCAWSNFEDLV